MAIKWSSWKSLGRPAETEVGRPVVQRNRDGRLEVFAGGRGRLFHIWQVAPNGGWLDRWLSEGTPSPHVGALAHVVGTNADGRQELFAVGEDGALWQKWQTAPNGGWSEWLGRGRPAGDVRLSTDQFTVGRNADGRQELFGVGSDGEIWQTWQTAPNGGWSHWQKLGKPPVGVRRTDRLSVGFNEDGRQELFAMGADDSLWHVWQVGPNVGWSHWESLGKPRDKFDSPEPPKDRDLSQPTVRANADGHLEVFSPGNGAFCNRWQEVWREGPNRVVWRREGWNAKPAPSPGVGIAWLETARNFERQLEVIAMADDGAVWHSWQIPVAPFWSKWESLGKPPAGLQGKERLSVGTNQDGRLEVFAVGGDGNIWQIWQVR
jgi:hypothetical protein